MDYAQSVKDDETSKMASDGSAWALRKRALHLTDRGEPVGGAALVSGG